MSFFDTLKQKTMEARDALVQEVGKFQNRDFMEACVASCALVAAADGTISSEEKQKMMKFIQQSDELKVFDTTDVIQVFTKITESLEFDTHIGKGDAFKRIGKLREKEDAARLMIRVCIAIANSDNEFDEKEKQVIREICKELNLVAADFDL